MYEVEIYIQAFGASKSIRISFRVKAAYRLVQGTNSLVRSTQGRPDE